jgi:hypothetical protein
MNFRVEDVSEENGITIIKVTNNKNLMFLQHIRKNERNENSGYS